MPRPWPNQKKVQRVKELRGFKLSFRNIAFIMRNKRTGKQPDIKTLHRWANYATEDSVGKLSTETIT